MGQVVLGLGVGEGVGDVFEEGFEVVGLVFGVGEEVFGFGFRVIDEKKGSGVGGYPLGFVFEADVGDDDRDEGDMELGVVGEEDGFEGLEESVVGGKGVDPVGRIGLAPVVGAVPLEEMADGGFGGLGPESLGVGEHAEPA